MAFETRCPECNARLKFEEAPDAAEAIECSRCGHVYDAADAKPIKKKKKVLAGGGDDDKPRRKKKSSAEKPVTGTPRKRKARKKKANLFFLWVMLGFAVVMGPIVGWVGYKLFFATGKVGALMAYVPPDCNWLRGCDVQRMAKYPGYKDQLDRSMKGPLEDCQTNLAKAAGKAPESFLDYAMEIKNKNGGSSGTMYVFQTILPYDSAAMLKGLGATEQNVDGQTVHRLSASQPGVLANAYVYCPAERHIVLVANQGNAMKMLKDSIAAKANPKESSIIAKLGACGTKASRAHMWQIMRPEGDLANKLKEEIATPLKDGMPEVSQKFASAKMMATWMYFGTQIKYGIGIECDSAETAESFVKGLKESTLSKGDDMEVPNALRYLFPFSMNKDFSDFKTSMTFLTKANCAYLEAKMSLEKSVVPLTYFNKTDMWEGESGTPGGFRR